jgi:hypothetical protein
MKPGVMYTTVFWESETVEMEKSVIVVTMATMAFQKMAANSHLN